MLTQKELHEYAESAIRRMESGERILCADDVLDYIAESDEWDDISSRLASAMNANAMGTRDTYVCWTQESAKPKMRAGPKTGYAYAVK